MEFKPVGSLPLPWAGIHSFGLTGGASWWLDAAGNEAKGFKIIFRTRLEWSWVIMPPFERALRVTALSRSLKLSLMAFIIWRMMKLILYRPHRRYWFKVHITSLTKFRPENPCGVKDHIQKISGIRLGVSLKLSFSSFEKIQNYDVTSGNHY